MALASDWFMLSIFFSRLSSMESVSSDRGGTSFNNEMTVELDETEDV